MAEETTLLAQQGDTNGAAAGDGTAKAEPAAVVTPKPGEQPGAGAQQTPEAKAEAEKKSAEDKAAAEQKTADEKAAADKKAAEDKAAEEQKAKDAAVPEKYEFKLPEGQSLDEGLAQKFSATAKELKLPQSAAQKLVEFYATQQAQQEAAFNQQRLAWRSEFQKDPKSAELLDNAKKALRLASPEERSFLADSYLGDHPHVLRFLAKVGAIVREDTLPEGAGAGKTQRSAAEILYGKSA